MLIEVNGTKTTLTTHSIVLIFNQNLASLFLVDHKKGEIYAKIFDVSQPELGQLDDGFINANTVHLISSSNGADNSHNVINIDGNKEIR